MTALLFDVIKWLWWSWIASSWSGGGPGHPSYPTAAFYAWVYGDTLRRWLRGEIDYE